MKKAIKYDLEKLISTIWLLLPEENKFNEYIKTISLVIPRSLYTMFWATYYMMKSENSFTLDKVTEYSLSLKTKEYLVDVVCQLSVYMKKVYIPENFIINESERLLSLLLNYESNITV